jgi:hypothetical protein
MKTIVRCAAIAVLLASAAISRAAGEMFPMGVWYEGAIGPARNDLIPADPAEAAKMYQRDFADIAAHGVNLAVVPNTPANHHKVLLDAAQASGVKLIIELGYEGDVLGQSVRANKPVDKANVKEFLNKTLTPIASHPALYRVQIIDEPPAGTYERYGEVADALRHFNPPTMPFSCLIGADNFDTFLKQSKSDVAVFDMYPYMVGTPVGDLKPLRAFEGVALKATREAQKNNAEAWSVLQCHSITKIHRFPTPGEIRCMSYLSLAVGNKGIFWFLYQTEFWNKEKNEVMRGLVDENFKGDDRWEEIGALTKKIKALAPTLMKLKLDDEQPKQEGSASIHTLHDEAGKAYVFAVNLDIAKSQKIKLRGTSRDAVATVTKLPGDDAFEPNRGDGQDLVWEAEVGPGEGALYRID